MKTSKAGLGWTAGARGCDVEVGTVGSEARRGRRRGRRAIFAPMVASIRASL